MDSELESTILEMVSDNPNGVTTERVCRFTHKSPQELGELFERLLASQKLLGFAGLWMSQAGFEAGTARLLESLRALHEASPTESEIAAPRAVAAAELKWEGKPLDRILSKLAADGKIERGSNGICLKEFILELTLRQRALLDRVIEELQREAISTPSPQTIAQVLGIPRQAVEEILRLGVRSGEVVQLTDVVFYTPAQFEALKSQVVSIAAGKPFTSTDLRDALHTTRKYVLPLLDRLDEIGLTEKQGAHRVVLPVG